MPWKLLYMLLALSMDPSQAYHHMFLLLIQILLSLMLTQGSNKLLNIGIVLLEEDDSHIQRDEFLTLLVSFPLVLVSLAPNKI